MERIMWPIKVDVENRGFICISQDCDSLDENAFVLLHPDQVDILIEWLKDVKSELPK